MNSRVGRWSAALFLGVLLSLLCILPCFAVGGVSQVNLHIGQTPDTVYLTYSAPDAAQGAVSVTGPEVLNSRTMESAGAGAVASAIPPKMKAR